MKLLATTSIVLPADAAPARIGIHLVNGVRWPVAISSIPAFYLGNGAVDSDTGHISPSVVPVLAAALQRVLLSSASSLCWHPAPHPELQNRQAGAAPTRSHHLLVFTPPSEAKGLRSDGSRAPSSMLLVDPRERGRSPFDPERRHQPDFQRAMCATETEAHP